MSTKNYILMHMVKYYSQNSPSDSEDMGLGVATKNINVHAHNKNIFKTHSLP